MVLSRTGVDVMSEQYFTRPNVQPVITNIGTTPEQRQMSTSEFKAKFDEMPEAIQQYIKETLLIELDAFKGDFLEHIDKYLALKTDFETHLADYTTKKTLWSGSTNTAITPSENPLKYAFLEITTADAAGSSASRGVVLVPTNGGDRRVTTSLGEKTVYFRYNARENTISLFGFSDPDLRVIRIDGLMKLGI